MNAKVKLIQTEYDNVLSRQIFLLLYSYFNICVESEPMVMLSIPVTIGGNSLNLEDTGELSILNKQQYCIIPFNESYIPNIIRGVMMEHPELKTEVMGVGDDRLLTLDEMEEGQSYQKVVICTVPKVDKERRDIMLETVDMFYNRCKVDMDKYRMEYESKQLDTLLGASSEEIDEARKELDKIEAVYIKSRDDMNDKKIKEIEDAYQRYLAEQEAGSASAKEEIESDETGGGLSMNMFSGGDE